MLNRISLAAVILGLAVLLLGIFVIYPMGTMIVQSFIYNSKLSLHNYLLALRQPGNLVALGHTLQISIGSMIGSTALGTLAAWIVARTDLPGRSLLRTAFVFPFLIPPFVGALAWRQLLGPVGYLSKIYMAFTGAESVPWSIYGAAGIVLVMIMHSYPLVYITALGGLERMNPELEEAAQSSGAEIFRVMRDVTLPLMAPTILAGAVLVFTTEIANFGIPAVLGYSENYFVLTTKIYQAVTKSFSNPNALSMAASLSMVLAVIAAGGIIAQKLILRGREYAVLSGKSMQPNLVRLGSHKVWLVPAAWAIVFVTTIAPVLSIFTTALIRAYGLPPTLGNLTLDNFAQVLFMNAAARRGIVNSLMLSAAAATIIAFLGALIAYILVRTKLPGREVLDFFSAMPYAVPGTVVALAMILAWLKPLPLTRIVLYNTIWILLIAYIARYLTFGVRSTAGSLQQVHPSLEEAARICGANWLQSFRDVMLPLITPGLFAGWFLVFMPCLRELTVSILLWSAGNETVGVMVFNLQEDGHITLCAALAMMMLAVLVGANLVTRRVTGGKLGY
jgi:iron(III) transport system permease protein